MTTIEWKKGLPLLYESFLVENYGSFITTCRYIESFHSKSEVHHFLFFKDKELVDILIFTVEKDTATSFNSLARMDEDTISQFSRKVFELFPLVSKITIDASFEKYSITPSVFYFESEDYILQLPTSVDLYYNALSTNTRQHVRNRTSRLKRDFPNVKFIAKLGSEIDFLVVQKIMDLGRERFKSNGKSFGIDSKYEEKLFELLRSYGFVFYVENDGEILAGNIGTIVNNSVYGHVLTHDNKYSKYSLGEICAVECIKYCIENKFTNFHFLWGKSDLKIRLLSTHYPLYSYYIFRNYSVDYYYQFIRASIRRLVVYFLNSNLLLPLKGIVKKLRRKFIKKY